MINHFNYPLAKRVVVCGDVHGDFRKMVTKLCDETGMEDTLLVVAGDCGFGFEQPEYYGLLYNAIARKLSRSRNCIAMVRGNHDDPSYFDGQTICHKRFRCVPDYSVFTAARRSILYVGGAVSVDRRYRIVYESYWPNEVPFLDRERLAEIGRAFAIDTVVTHTAPSFCEPVTKASIIGWIEGDPDLIDDCNRERRVMNGVLDALKKAGHPLMDWCYGHYHRSWRSRIDGVLYTMLDILEFKELSSTLNQ